MPTIEELQADNESLRDKLTRSQEGREADNRAAEAKLLRELGRQATSLGEQYTADTKQLHATHLAHLKTQQREHEAEKLAIANHLGEQAKAALEQQAKLHNAQLAEAAKINQELAASLKETQAAIELFKAADSKRRETIATVRKLATDAEYLLGESLRNA